MNMFALGFVIGFVVALVVAALLTRVKYEPRMVPGDKDGPDY